MASEHYQHDEARRMIFGLKYSCLRDFGRDGSIASQVAGRPRHLMLAALTTVFALSVLGLPSASAQVAVKAGLVVPIVGEPIENGVILINEGKIEAVGKDLKIPVDYKVVQADDGVVMPGLIDPHSSDGMSQANEQNTNVPFLSVVDSIDPNAPYFEQCRRNGVTTAAVVPGNSTMIGGRSAIVKTSGGYVNDMVLVRDAGLKISLRPIRGSRMSHLARLRRELDVAKRSIEDEIAEEKEKEEKEKAEAKKSSEKSEKPKEGEEKKDEKKDPPKEGEAKDEKSDGDDKKEEDKKPEEEEAESLRQLKRLLRGEQEAFVYCDAAMDVAQAITLSRQYGFKARLVLSSDCYKAAELLADADATVVLDPELVFWETDPRTREDKKIVVSRLMHDEDVDFVFQANLGSSPQSVGSGYFWFQAATAISYGMDRGEALERLTLAPAKLLGIDEFVGSIEPGKDADLVIYSGDPLKIDSWVMKTMVAGEVVYDRDKDDKLKRLLEEPKS
ncbi:MAG: amidohydrolase family protein [Planctomycetota bacterium]